MFVQASLVSGFSYLDRSGAVLNVIATRYKTIDVVDPQGTVLREPKDPSDPYAIRFGFDRIWLHFIGAKSPEDIVPTAPPIIRKIAELLQVSQFDRLGLRAEYYVQCADVLKAGYQVAKRIMAGRIGDILTPSPREDHRLELTIPFVYEEKQILLRVRWISISRPATQPGDYPGPGLLFDVDVGERSQSNRPAFRRVDVPHLTQTNAVVARKLVHDIGQDLIRGIEL